MTAATEVVYQRPWVYPKQRDAIFHDKRYGLIEASTKSGKTVGCLIWLAEQAMRHAGNYWWVAPSYPQTEIGYRRMKEAFRESGLAEPNESRLTLTLPNRAVVWFKTGEKPDLLYGEDVWAVVVDEGSRVREEAWHALRSTLTATRGPARIIGNVKGRKNWMYRMARRAEAGAADMHYAKLTWQDAVEAGVLDAEEVEDARRNLPEAVFNELYACEPSEDGGNPFGLQHIAACIGPLSSNSPVVWGWDLARAHDYTVGVGIDRNGHVCRIERWQTDWEHTMVQILSHVGGTPSYVEQNGVGDAPVELLRKQRESIRGFLTTAQSKQALMEGLAVAIQQHRTQFPDGILVSELRSFEYEVTRTGVRYSAPEGCFDDCVMAFAIAWHGYRKAQGVTPTVPHVVTRESKWARAGGG